MKRLHWLGYFIVAIIFFIAGIIGFYLESPRLIALTKDNIDYKIMFSVLSAISSLGGLYAGLTLITRFPAKQ